MTNDHFDFENDSFQSQQSRSSYTERRVKQAYPGTGNKPPHFTYRNRPSAPNFSRERFEVPQVASPPVRRGPPSCDHILFNGRYYDLNQLRASSGLGKRITINKDQVHGKSRELVKSNTSLDSISQVPFVTPFEGFFVILFGGDSCSIGEMPVNAVMLPKMVLKKALLWEAA